MRNVGEKIAMYLFKTARITKTCPCNIQRFFSAVKTENFIRKILIFSIFEFKTLIQYLSVGTLVLGNRFEIAIDYRFIIGRTEPTSYRLCNRFNQLYIVQLPICL